VERNPNGWPEFLIVTAPIPSGKNHTGDLLDIGPLFAISRWAIQSDEQREHPMVRLAKAWIPRLNKWDHVCTTPTHGLRTPFSEALWRALSDLEPLVDNVVDDFCQLVRQGCQVSPKATEKALMRLEESIQAELRVMLAIRKKTPA